MKSIPSVNNQNISGEKVSVWPGGQGSDGGCTHYIKTLAQVRKNNFSKMLKKIFRGKVLWIKMSKYGCSGRQGGVKM